MVERDEEGRPKATRNAGAFLGPLGGMVPVPSDVLDKHWRRRKGKGRRIPDWAVVTIVVIVLIVLLVLLGLALTPDTAAAVLLPATS